MSNPKYTLSEQSDALPQSDVPPHSFLVHMRISQIKRIIIDQISSQRSIELKHARGGPLASSFRATVACSSSSSSKTEVGKAKSLVFAAAKKKAFAKQSKSDSARNYAAQKASSLSDRGIGLARESTGQFVRERVGFLRNDRARSFNSLEAVGPSSAGMVSVGAIIGCAAAVDFGIQFVGWAISSIKKTEKYYDLCGSGAFAAVGIATLATTQTTNARSSLATALLLFWAARLGAFLVTRVHKDNGDKRFDGIKENPGTFAIYWFIQGIWVLVTAMPVILINANAATQAPLRALDFVGLTVFLSGFLMEIVADHQKRAFKADVRNKGKYIDTGLWSISRHPNYFGEISLWTGMSMIGLSGVSKYGAGEIIGCVLSPLLVTFLITKLSGIPLLEKSADERWGNEEAYQKYKKETPELIPFIGPK